MQVHLGSLALGGVLAAGGFLLGSGTLLRPVQAGATTDVNGRIVTSDDSAPGRIYHWETMGSELKSVTVYDCDRDAGTVAVKRIEPRNSGGRGGGR